MSWGWPARSRKAHYFDGGVSLCRRWMYVGEPLENQAVKDKPGPDDCKACWRKVKQ